MDALTRPKRKSGVPAPSAPRRAAARATPTRPYPDLHDHIRALEKAGQLVRVTRPINKDTEMHPLVRWQFRGGIEEKDRKAFLFTNVTDSKGKKYDIPVLVGGLAANREIYRIGIGCAFEEIDARWVAAAARADPAARGRRTRRATTSSSPARELDKPGRGPDGIPLPISTPGFDIAPYATLSQYITRDPDTGVQNMGNYRGQVKARRRLGMNPSLELRPGIYNHWEKLRARGFKKLPCAVVLGAPPCVTFASVQKLPESLDELHVAGALVGAPINVVKAKTVDLLVPAEAEIVIEGFIDTEYLEPEAPFGESHGHVNLQEFNAFMDVTAITRRRDAILTSIISQVTPSESSLIKRIGMEPLFTELPARHARHQGRQAGVDARAADQHPQGDRAGVRARHAGDGNLARAVRRGGAAPRRRQVRDRGQRRHRSGERRRAAAGRCRTAPTPALDMHVLPHRDQGHGPRSLRNGGQDASVLIDATLEGGLPADLAAQARVHGARARSSGRSSACRSSSPRRRGSAIRSASGRPISTPPPSARCAATISRPASCWRRAAAPTSP